MNEETLAKWKEDRRARKLAEERKKVLMSCLTDVAPLPRHQRYIFYFKGLHLFALGENDLDHALVFATIGHPVPPTTFHCSMDRIS